MNKEKEMGKNLSYADLRGADFYCADLRGTDLSYSDMRGADLGAADIRNANLRNAILRDADLSVADLRGTDLSYADLSGVNLDHADLSSADLSYANLCNADLRCSKITDAVFDSVNLINARLKGAVLNGKMLLERKQYLSVDNFGEAGQPLIVFFFDDKSGPFIHCSEFRGSFTDFLEGCEGASALELEGLQRLVSAIFPEALEEEEEDD